MFLDWGMQCHIFDHSGNICQEYQHRIYRLAQQWLLWSKIWKRPYRWSLLAAKETVVANVCTYHWVTIRCQVKSWGIYSVFRTKFIHARLRVSFQSLRFCFKLRKLFFSGITYLWSDGCVMYMSPYNSACRKAGFISTDLRYQLWLLAWINSNFSKSILIVLVDVSP